jgi:hypothetical protein
MSDEVRQMRVSEPADEQIAAYRPVSAWAIVSLLIGLVSPLALVDPSLWAAPVIAGVVCLLAFRQIKKNAPDMIGRKAALVGLWLAVLSLTAACSDWLYFRGCVRREAQQAAMFWFELLAKDRPELAFQLTLVPGRRHALDERIWDYYVDEDRDKRYTALKNYVALSKDENSPGLVRTLLALGQSADVRYLGTLDLFYEQSMYIADQLYGVTFVESGQKKTFLVTVRMARHTEGLYKAVWRVVYAIGGVDESGQKPS